MLQGLRVTDTPDDTQNQWGLTRRQIEILRALCEHGEDKRAAIALGLSPTAIRWHMARVKPKMGGMNRIQCLIVFDRWHRLAYYTNRTAAPGSARPF
jgi:DNA-binding CsgD family transcriptional regulator